MQERTGAIAHFETDDDAERAGYKRKLTAEQHALVSPMNRHDRRKWATEQRTAERKGKKQEGRRDV